eukprot:TRINITY_DN21526_c0_g1_i1.p1 TRINITY_DN21526_c0_g1~~TRINITY_DN21526_c0_g1_i1.p1  ORF type:complete len:156 (-),score=38.94 TRINITY_DN21526_c0_g1_i1:517-984(-)
MAGSEPEIDLSKLSLPQLQQLKEQFDGEMTVYNDSIVSLRSAINRYTIAGNAVGQLAEENEGKKVMVPLTSSLYVPGELINPNKVLIDIGTNYFVERSAAEGLEYCERRVKFIKGQHDKLIEMVGRQRDIVNQVTMHMQAKMRQQAAATEMGQVD